MFYFFYKIILELTFIGNVQQKHETMYERFTLRFVFLSIVYFLCCLPNSWVF